jgi:hypothetical protein
MLTALMTVILSRESLLQETYTLFRFFANDPHGSITIFLSISYFPRPKGVVLLQVVKLKFPIRKRVRESSNVMLDALHTSVMQR